MKRYIFLLFIGAGLIIAYFLLQNENLESPISRSGKIVTSIKDNEKYISGTISSVRNSLAVDGNCEILVGEKAIVIAHSGERLREEIPKEKGMIEGISCNNASNDLSNFIGKKVEAYGVWNGNYLTVEGSKNYYIKVR